jgi:hypothetical protein
LSFIETVDLAGFLNVEQTTLGWLGEFAVRTAEEAVKGILDGGYRVGHVEDDEVSRDGTGTDAILLFGLPVEVTKVVLDETELDSATDYVLEPYGILRRLPFGLPWTQGRGNVVITYTHGWSEIGDEDGNGNPLPNLVPMDVRDAALFFAKGVFEAGKAPPPGVASETTPWYSYTVQSGSGAIAAAATLRPALSAKLARYVSPGVA